MAVSREPVAAAAGPGAGGDRAVRRKCRGTDSRWPGRGGGDGGGARSSTGPRRAGRAAAGDHGHLDTAPSGECHRPGGVSPRRLSAVRASGGAAGRGGRCGEEGAGGGGGDRAEPADGGAVGPAGAGRELVRALTISRTEMLRSCRTASLRSYRACADIMEGWVWHAAQDRRTCGFCWSQHGRVFPIDAPFATHPRRRCSAVPRTVGWDAILGEKGRDIPDTRPKTEKGEDLFERLSDERKQQILGPAKYAAYQHGPTIWSVVSAVISSSFPAAAAPSTRCARSSSPRLTDSFSPVSRTRGRSSHPAAPAPRGCPPPRWRRLPARRCSRPFSPWRTGG